MQLNAICRPPDNARRLLTKTLRVMKMMALLILAAFLQVSAKGYSQQVTLYGKNLSMEKVFEEIRRQTGYEFLYNSAMMEKASKVDIDVKDVPLAEALDICFKNQPFTYEVIDKTIVVRKKIEIKTEVPLLPGEIKGRVTTEAGEPLENANIIIKRTKKGAITNANGEFTLKDVRPDDEIAVSYVGYQTELIKKIGNRKELVIYLKVATNELDKAVVQAYGKTSQRYATGDIGKVTAEEIERVPVMNPLLALEGKVAGLDVSMVNGYASAPVKIELRGRSAINGIFPSDPLYIVDGVPLTVNEITGSSGYSNGSVGFDQADISPAFGQSPFFSISPSDIESIEVLKDADATAIYGSRGANGVILITTKKGKAGKSKFSLSVGEGASYVDRFWNMLDTKQYLAMRREAFINSGTNPDPILDFDVNGTWDTSRNTNWQKVLYGGMGQTTNVQGSLSGGDAKTTYRISAGYTKSVGVTTVSGGDERGTFSTNLAHHSLDNRLTISTTSIFSYSQSNMINIPGSVLMAPDAPSIYDSLGNLNWAGWGGKNQNASAESAYPFGGLKMPYVGKTVFLNSTLTISFEIATGLEISTNFGINDAHANQISTMPIVAQNPLNDPTGSLTIGNTSNLNWIIEPQINYHLNVAQGKLDLLVGSSSSENSTETLLINGSGYQSDLLISNLASAPTYHSSHSYGEYRYFGIFGRIAYNWENKYIFSFNGRRDGSSRFGPGKQYGNFGSIGAAWIVSEESWFKSSLPTWISFLKVHGSYGITGSDGVPNYAYLSQYSSQGVSTYDSNSALLPIIDPNSKYHWQTNKKLEASLNIGLFNDRITIETAWYRDRSGNQLVSFPIPLLTGFSTVIANSPALVQNIGWEITASANLVKTNKFSFSLNVNVAINTNKLVSYPNFDQSPYTAIFRIGQPLNIYNVLHNVGVDPLTGQYSFFDKNHDGQIQFSPGNVGDDSYSLNYAPKYFGGAGMNFTFGSFAINLFFNFKNQIGKNAYITTPFAPGFPNSNLPAEILGKEWKYPGEVSSTYAKFTTIYSQSYADYYVFSDGVYTSASFIRLSNISLAYNISSVFAKKVGLQSCTIFLHTNNIFTITNYKGLDPETQNFGGMPPLKTIEFGMNLNL